MRQDGNFTAMKNKLLATVKDVVYQAYVSQVDREGGPIDNERLEKRRTKRVGKEGG